MRVWRRLSNGSMVDAGLPEHIGDLVFVYGVDEILPIKVREALRTHSPRPEDDYVVVDIHGIRYASDSETFGNPFKDSSHDILGRIRSQLPKFPPKIL